MGDLHLTGVGSMFVTFGEVGTFGMSYLPAVVWSVILQLT